MPLLILNEPGSFVSSLERLVNSQKGEDTCPAGLRTHSQLCVVVL